MSVYRIDFDESECMYSMIKEEKVYDKYMEIWEKVNYIIKKSIVNLYIYIYIYIYIFIYIYIYIYIYIHIFIV